MPTVISKESSNGDGDSNGNESGSGNRTEKQAVTETVPATVMGMVGR